MSAPTTTTPTPTTGIGPGQQTPSVTSAQDLANAALNQWNPSTASTGQGAVTYGPNYQDAANVESQQTYDPKLANGTAATYQSIKNHPNDTLDTGTGSITGADPATVTTATAGQADASHATAGQATASTNPGASTYNAATIGSFTPQAIAAQGQVDPRSLMQNQYTQLLNFPPNQIPDWARGAVSAANASLAAHGLSSSSVAGQAITGALMSAALPIAANDSKVFEDMNLQNLSNQQQAVIVNTQARVQTMMSDQAAINAAQQFNSTSTNQTNQFYSSLATQVSQFNAAQLTAVSQSNAALDTQTSQFNATQNTATSEFNSGQANAVSQFNSNLKQQQQEFNANNALVIAQSNVQWQRQLNTANTAGINQANNTNAANLLNISNTAMNNIWQQMRDNASYSFTAGQNAQNRAAAMATTQLNSQDALQYLNTEFSLAQQQALGSALGGFASNLINGGIKSLFGNNNPSGLTALNGDTLTASGSVTGVGDLGGSAPSLGS